MAKKSTATKKTSRASSRPKKSTSTRKSTSRRRSTKSSAPAKAHPASPLIASISGVRGIAGEGFSPLAIAPYIDAFARMMKGRRVVMGSDSRPSGKWVVPMAEGILRAHGVDVVSLGLSPTPTIALMVRHLKAGGGLAITASHNPEQYNGLKFFHSAGEYFTAEMWKELQTYVDNPAKEAGTSTVGKRGFLEDGAEYHLTELTKALQMPERQRASKRPKVIIDCCNSAGVEIAPDVADAYGALFQLIFADTSRSGFPRHPEPMAESLSELRKAVINEGADIGFALDPDADRLALIDEKGEAIGEERTLLLAADAYLSTAKRKSPIVTNLSSSRVLDDLAAKHKVAIFRTKIGEAHVLEGMKQHKAKIGGEGNGGVIFPAVQPSRDAASAIALILVGLQQRGTSLSEWNDSFPKYVFKKEKVPVDGVSVSRALGKFKRAFKKEKIDEQDGVKVIFSDRWLHVRPSNTEPIVRIFAEAPDEEGANELVERARKLLG